MPLLARLIEDIRRERKVVYFAPCEPRQGMGGGARLNVMISALEQLDFAVELFSYTNTESFEFERTKLSGKTSLQRISVPSTLYKGFKLAFVVLLLLTGLRACRSSSFIFSHSPSIASGFIALLASKLTRRPLIIDHVDAKDPDTPWYILKSVLASADLVFTNTDSMAREVKQQGIDRVVHIPTFLDLDSFTQNSHVRGQVREELGLAPDEFVVGYFGSFSRLEGLPVLVHATSKLLSEIPNLKVILVGSRNVKSAIDVESLISELSLWDHIRILPPRPYHEVPRFLQCADVLVAPKIDAPENRVGNPSKVYEYLASGVPCIASAIGEAGDLLRQYKSGILVRPGDPIDLARQIARVFSHPNLRAEYGKRGREMIGSSHSIDSQTTTIEEALDSIDSPP